MLPYLTGRLLALVPVLLVVAVVVFLLIHLTPGDPARVLLGQDATPEQVQTLRHARRVPGREMEIGRAHV